MTKNNSSQSPSGLLSGMILGVFELNPSKSFNYKQIATRVNASDAFSRKLVEDVLQELVEQGVLKELGHGKFQIQALHSVVIGRVDLTADGSAYIVPDAEEEMDGDIFVAPRKLKNALNGDKVKVYVYAKKNKKRKEGEVIEILHRHKMVFTGLIQLSQKFAFLVPDDRKMLHDIFIPLMDLKGANDGDKALVEIVDWIEGAKNPIGKVKTVLGKQGENNTEMNAILAEYGFPLEFPKEVEDEANVISEEITAQEVAKRRDFRKTTTFTIDPFDAKDFDDAISVVNLPNGNVEVGVHIADVAHYIETNSALDKEAYDRATSVYLVDRVIPMLPERLSNGLCSLRPKEEKLCFSAVFELDNNANILNQWFGKTVIYSDRRFTYEEVQDILEGAEGDFKEELFILNNLAHLLRVQRFKQGAINFESEEVKFKLDENGKPIGVYVKERKDAHKLVEDFMLLANKKVAEFVAKKGVKQNSFPFVYRAHDTPNTDSLEEFSKFAGKFGYKISTKSNRDIAYSLNKLMDDVVGKKEQNVLTQLAIRTMAKAIYTTKTTSHYGLAFDYYTHFTSPIRRYPDVMVHRMLAYYLSGGNPEENIQLEAECVHCSQKEKKAADAERASIKYKQAEYLSSNVGSIYEGIISGVTEWGMYVELAENKCEGMIRLRDISDDFYVLDAQNYCIIGQRKKKVYQLGDMVRVKVKQVNLSKRQIDLALM